MRLTALLTMVLLAVLPAAGADDTLIYLRPADALNLNPWQADDLFSSEVAANLFEGLVRFQRNSAAVEPCLAVSWKIGDDGRLWQFTLRRGVRFHDGTPFDAQAVVHSFQSRLQQGQTAYQRLSVLFSYIKSVRALGPQQVEILLDRPYAPFLVALADSAAFIQPPTSTRPSFKPVGTGPFRLAGWSRNRTLILTRFEDYWGERPGVEKVIFKRMPDPLGRLLQIRNGSADLTAIQSGKEYSELALRGDIRILSNPSLSTHYLGFNTRRPPFDRVAVRSAVRHLIPKGNMVKKIFQNLAQPALSPLPASMPPQAESEDRFDPAAARQLLKAAGLGNGFSCSLYHAEGQPGIQELVDLLAVMARNAGITVRKVRLPFSELVKAASRGEHDMLIMGWSSGPDPDFFLTPLFTLIPGNRNLFFYHNPALTRLLDRGQVTREGPERQRLYLEALDILRKDVPWVPLFHLIDNIACRRSVSGLFFTPLGQVIFREAKKETVK